jgi:hypothetical protein
MKQRNYPKLVTHQVVMVSKDFISLLLLEGAYRSCSIIAVLLGIAYKA